VLYLILDLFGDGEKLPEEVQKYLDGFHHTQMRTVQEKVFKEVTETVVDPETGDSKEVSKKVPEIVEKEVEVTVNGLVELLGKESDAFGIEFEKMMKKKEHFSLMIGEDFYYHDKAENLAKLLALAEEVCSLDLVLIPPRANALGVALICDLDKDASGYTVGYNENGDFRLSALGDGDLDMPALNQQEGTFTALDRRVVPTNAALPYAGYELNDLLKVLATAPEETVGWTEKLPTAKGFRAVAFDDLPNSYGNDGSDNRGYLLEMTCRSASLPEVAQFDADEALRGEVACRCNPARQFSDFSDKAHQIMEPFALYVSPEKATELGNRATVVFDSKSLTLDVVVDEKIEGNIVLIPDFRSAEDIYGLFGASRYRAVTIRKG